jgi:hypothetical protein
MTAKPKIGKPYCICHVCDKSIDRTEHVVWGHPDFGGYHVHAGSCADQLRAEMPFLYELEGQSK